MTECHKIMMRAFLALLKTTFSEGDDELPRSKYFTHADRKLLRILLWLLITEYNEDNNQI